MPEGMTCGRIGNQKTSYLSLTQIITEKGFPYNDELFILHKTIKFVKYMMVTKVTNIYIMRSECSQI